MSNSRRGICFKRRKCLKILLFFIFNLFLLEIKVLLRRTDISPWGSQTNTQNMVSNGP